MLEVCVDNLQSAKNAVYNGADEVEVCSCLPQGGLTPSAGLVKQVLNMVGQYMDSLKNSLEENYSSVKKPKVNVMIRCRAGPDFCYTDLEIDTMLEDIEIFKDMGVDRFVFGSLTDSRQVNDVHCIKVLAKAYPTPVTFHRAFDLCKEPISTLDKVVQMGFSRVLTSGQRQSAAEEEAVTLIKSLLEVYGDKIEIMPGAGITVENAKTFLDIGCNIIHSSCKKLIPLLKVDEDLGMGDGQNVLYLTDGNIVRRMKNILSNNVR